MSNSHLMLAFDQAFDKQSWHGTNLKGSIRGLKAKEASWRPHRDRHNIWEQVLHCAYWKYVVQRRLVGQKRGSFPRDKSDWPIPSGKDESAWKSDVRLLVDTHQLLRQAISGFTAKALATTPSGSKVSNLSLITGIIAHDLYHAGQIQLLRRLGAKRKQR